MRLILIALIAAGLIVIGLTAGTIFASSMSKLPAATPPPAPALRPAIIERVIEHEPIIFFVLPKPLCVDLHDHDERIICA